MTRPDGLAHALQRMPESPWYLFDLIGGGVAVTTPDGTVEFCNTALLALTAGHAGVLPGSSIFELLIGGATGDLERLHQAALATDDEVHAGVRSDRGRFSANVVLKRSNQPDGRRVIWSFGEPRRNEPAFEVALWGTEIGLWDWDVPTDRLIWINDWCEHSHFAAFAGPGHEKSWCARIHPEDLPAYREALNGHLEGRTPPYETEYRLRNRNQAWVWIQERGRVIERDPSGRARRAVGICLDVGERHHSARALERSESQLGHAVWGASVGLWDIEVATDAIHWSNDWCDTVDLDPCEGANYSQSWDAGIHLDDYLSVIAGYEAVVEGRREAFEVEYRIRTRSGTWRWILSRGRATARDASGRALRLAGVTIDIDSRKRMELALRDSEARLEAAIWGADLGLWEWKLDDDSLLWLSDWPTRYGIDPAERIVRREQWLDRVHPLDGQKYAAEDIALVFDGRNSAESDYRILASSGEWRWVNVRTRVIERNAAGRALRIVGACIDVDARRRAEQMLRTQAMILETMLEGVVLVTLNGRIEFTNPAFDRMFGRGAGELQGISVAELFNSRTGQSAAAALEGLLAQHSRGGKSDMLFRRLDGSQFSGEILSAGIELSGEKRILVVVQDVSERKQLESEIIEIANRERRRLGADLHDGIGQELTGISLMLRGLAKRTGAAAFDDARELDHQRNLDEIIALVNHAIQSTRRMALGISPVTLERGGLLPALKTLVGWARDSYNIEVRLRLSVRCALRIGESAATHLHLITQEAINNAVRHGRARSVVVTLRTSRTLLSLSITDDGVGIAEHPARGAGMGLKLMEYRSAVIGGVMRIKRLPGAGTRIRTVCRQDAAAPKIQ
jgi:PAS domain S-box-containing protein